MNCDIRANETDLRLRVFAFCTFFGVKYKLRPKFRTLGRAAVDNPNVRYEKLTREGVDDGWAWDDDLPVLRTQVTVEVPRKVITRNSSPDLSFDWSINPYRGGEHGCIYCYARPSHAYLGLSPGLDLETQLIARPQATNVLLRGLRAKGYLPQTIAIGTNTDPYQPIERDRKNFARAFAGVVRVRSSGRDHHQGRVSHPRYLHFGPDGGQGPGADRDLYHDARSRDVPRDGAARALTGGAAAGDPGVDGCGNRRARHGVTGCAGADES